MDNVLLGQQAIEFAPFPGDSEEQGGLTADIVITEENDDDDIADSDDTEDSEDLAKKLDSANAYGAEMRRRIKEEQDSVVRAVVASDESVSDTDMVVVKKEIKTEPLDPLVVKLEAASLNASLKEEQNKSWPPVVKQELRPASPILAGGGGGAVAPPSGPTDLQMQVMMNRLADMTALIQTQRAEMQVWREEMRELRREEVGHFKSMVDESTTEAANELRKNSSRYAQGCFVFLHFPF